MEESKRLLMQIVLTKTVIMTVAIVDMVTIEGTMTERDHVCVREVEAQEVTETVGIDTVAETGQETVLEETDTNPLLYI